MPKCYVYSCVVSDDDAAADVDDNIGSANIDATAYNDIDINTADISAAADNIGVTADDNDIDIGVAADEGVVADDAVIN
jgi:hypothetical protein